MDTIVPTVLILSSRFDFSCDFVVAKLIELEIPYFRLNSEDLPQVHVMLDPIGRELSITSADFSVQIDQSTLKSVYFRRPVYLREYGVPFAIEDQFSRIQCAAFVRNLMVFDKSLWMNHPAATYFAEHKAVQLSIAARTGFVVPQTLVQNTSLTPDEFAGGSNEVVLKGLDTVLAREAGKEIFGFTHIVHRQELVNERFEIAPVTVQELLDNKIDIRVTVVLCDLFAIEVRHQSGAIRGDWRTLKNEVSYVPHILPGEIEKLCLSYVQRLGLNFAAIDLAFVGGTYYFLEINPTGEWAWLVEAAKMSIDEAIARALGHGNFQ